MVFSIDAAQARQIETLVREGRYRTQSELVREALAEKLAAVSYSRVAEQVAQYCAVEVAAGEDDDLIAAQAFDDPEPADDDTEG